MILSRFSLATVVTLSALTGLGLFTGCAIGPVSGTVAAPDTVVPSFTGSIHGGPNPIVGARVVIYATTSGGYGATASALQEATQISTTAHQDTDINGDFKFAGGFTCPAGQYAYVVAYGGNTGSSAANPNSVLVDALGSCSSLYPTGTSSVPNSTYSGSTIWISELTTIAAGYALGNFTTISGNSSSGFTVNIGAPSTNNATTGTVTAGATPTYASPGLRDAFANANLLVNYAAGGANTVSANGAVIPTVLINTLGNVLQACVNSTGGGTNSTGAATSTLSSSDGTVCGKLFSFTSYSATAATGPNAGTTTTSIPTNTLSAMINLAKRPSGNSTLWDPTCSTSGGSGATTGITCIYNLASPSGFYQPTLSSAPPDYVMGVSYPKGSFGTAAVATCGTSGTPIAVTTNSLLYPWAVATDIDDNLVILNEDSSAGTCYALLTTTNSGTSIGSSAWVTLPTATSTTNAKQVAYDQFGHVIVPVGVNNVVNVYSAGPSDTTIGTPVAVTDSSIPTFAAVDNSGNVYIGGQGASNNLQLMTITATSHSAPTYTIATAGSTAVTSKLSQFAMDINGNVFSNSTSSSASSVYSFSPGGTVYGSKAGITGTTSNGIVLAPDSYGNLWTVVENAALTANPVYQTSYSGSGTGFVVSTPATTISVAPPAVKINYIGAMDGNNTLWWSDYSTGSTSTNPTTPGYLRGVDTVNSYTYPELIGCRVLTGNTACGSIGSTSSSTPYSFYATRGQAVDAAGSLWVVNGTQGQLNQIIGLAAPTLPLFIHNGTSIKP